MLSEDYGGDVSLTGPRTVYDQLSESVAKHPDRTALVCMHQPATLYGITSHGEQNYLRWTYAQLGDAVEHLAANLHHAGVKPGMPIATIMQNGVEWVLLFYAAMRLRCPLVPINPRNVLNTQELEHMLRTAAVRVIFVSDMINIVEKLEKSMPSVLADMVLKTVVNEQGLRTPWTSLPALMVNLSATSLQQHIGPEPDDLLYIIYTSGSTALPKACPLTHRSFVISFDTYVTRSPGLDHNAIMCNLLPNNHAMGILATTTFLKTGATVVYPGPVFSSKTALEAFQKEKCTDMNIVPTMLYAMLMDVASGIFPKPTTLKRCSAGGSGCTAELFSMAQDGLGAEWLRCSYGMSEGSPLRAYSQRDPEALRRGFAVDAGKVIPGARIRVCGPDTQVPLPRGQLGELHQSGPQMMTGYIGKDRSSDWYTDEQGEWFRTGDQVIMEEDGTIVMTGRYKEIIIRGGENISPSVIESVLNMTNGIEAQIVGAPDMVAGEVPVAVIKTSQEFSPKHLQSFVLKQLGPSFVPEGILTLKDLDLHEFPRTVSGKIKKTELATIVRKYREGIETVTGDDGHGMASTRAAVLSLWSRLLGVKEAEIETSSPITNFTDSITVIRFRERLRKEQGHTVSLEELQANPTIEDQIKLLAQRPVSTNGHAAQPAQKARPKRQGPPKVEDMAHTAGDEDVAQATRDLIEETLNSFHLTWDDVEDVMPAYDQAQVWFVKKRDQSWAIRSALVTDKVDSKHLREALEKALTNSPLAHGFLVRLPTESSDKDLALYVTIRASQSWLDQLITEGGSVETADDLDRFALEDPRLPNATMPGPFFHAHIVHVRQTNSYGLICSQNHVAYDAMCAQLFNEDFEQALADPDATLTPHGDYKLWADTVHSMRYSPEAEAATRWHIKRIRNLTSHRAALWPPQRAPEWFHGSNEEGWNPSATATTPSASFSNPSRKLLSGKRRCTDGVDLFEVRSFPLPPSSLRKLHEKLPSLTGPTIAKTALALLNIHHTSHTHAVFSSLEACRSGIAFVPSSVTEQLDVDCADMPGPMYMRVVDLIEVRRQETVLSMLGRVQEEQALLSKHAGAPTQVIIERLGTEPDGSGAGDLVEELGRRQILNWIPGMAGTIAARVEEKSKLNGGVADGGSANTSSSGASGSTGVRRNKGTTRREDEGLAFCCGMGGKDGATFYVRGLWDDANISAEEAELWVGQLGAIVTWIVDEANWERRSAEFKKCL